MRNRKHDCPQEVSVRRGLQCEDEGEEEAEQKCSNLSVGRHGSDSLKYSEPR